jgi:hypothetical protein
VASPPISFLHLFSQFDARRGSLSASKKALVSRALGKCTTRAERLCTTKGFMGETAAAARAAEVEHYYSAVYILGRKRIESWETTLLKLAEGLGLRAIADKLQWEGVDISYRTVGRRLKELRALQLPLVS